MQREKLSPHKLDQPHLQVFMRIIQRRLENTLDGNQSRDQAGFRKGFSTTDHIHVINQLLEKSQEYNFPLYLLFVDYEKAFDSVKHQELFRTLQTQGIRGKMHRILKLVYQTATGRITLEKPGETFPVRKGVRQGDPLSPKMFSAVLEDIFRRCDFPDTAGIRVDGSI